MIRSTLATIAVASVAAFGIAGCGSTIGGDSAQTFYAGGGEYFVVAAGSTFTYANSNAVPTQVDALPTGAIKACTGWSGQETVYYDPTVSIGQVMAQADCLSIPQGTATP